MDLNIFTKKVDDLVNEFNLAQSEAAGNPSLISSNFDLYYAKTFELEAEFREDQKDISLIAVDHRKALYKLDLLEVKLKAKQETSITLPSNY